jgi:hypothetical protein
MSTTLFVDQQIAHATNARFAAEQLRLQSINAKEQVSVGPASKLSNMFKLSKSKTGTKPSQSEKKSPVNTIFF